MNLAHLKTLAYEANGDLITWRRHLHAHPELSFHEVETSRFIRERLDQFGIPWTNPSGNSVVGVIRGNRPGKTVALRADIDALPIEEENTFSFRSTRRGVMHACGHDGHTAILLGVAKLLAANPDFPGTVKLLFQEAEELPPGGAQALIKAGALADVDHVMGLHLWSDIPTGRAEIVEGPQMAAADMFTARIQGKGGHGASPHQTVDALVVASNFVMNLQTIVSRKVDPVQPAVVTVGSLHTGNTFNIIADSAELKGTLRSFDDQVRLQLTREVERTLKAVCAQYGAEYEYQYVAGYPALINHPLETRVFAEAAAEILGTDNVTKAAPNMGGEDFAYYLRERPGAFIWLGSGSQAKESDWPHHHPRFTIDEDALPLGVELMARTALKLLGA